MILSQKTINERIESFYGTNVEGKPKFRLVWSEDVIEYMKKEADSVWESGWYPKYKFIPVENCWVLEYLTDRPNNPNGSSDFYEPLWVFYDSKGKGFAPDLKKIEYLIYCWLHRSDKDARVRKTEDEDMKGTREQLYQELFGNESEMGDMFSQGSAILLPGKDF